MLGFIPTIEEIEALKAYGGPMEDLGVAERYFMNVFSCSRSFQSVAASDQHFRSFKSHPLVRE